MVVNCISFDYVAPPKVECKEIFCATGTPIVNVNIMAGQADPVAQEVSAYPAWLWSEIEMLKQAPLSAGELEGKAKEGGRLLNRKELRLIRKALIREQNLKSAS